MNKFKEYDLKLSDKEEKLVNNYLEDIKNFIDKYGIDEELYRDIEDRVFDKLKEEKDLDQVKIKKILKEVGDVKEIFSDYIEEIEEIEKKKQNVVKKGFSKGIDFTTGIFSGLFKLIKKILKFSYKFLGYGFLIFLVLFLVSFLVFLIFLLAGYFTHFTLFNIEIFGTFPKYYSYGLVFGIISIFIFSLGLIWYIFSKKSLNKYLLSFGLLAFFIALFLCISTVFNLIEKYTNVKNFNKSYEFEIGEISPEFSNLNLQFADGDKYSMEPRIVAGSPVINIESGTGEKIKVDIKYQIYGEDQIIERVYSQLNDWKLKVNGNILTLHKDGGQTFKGKVPLTIVGYDMTVYLPKKYKYMFSYYGYAHYLNIGNTEVIDTQKEYINYCDPEYNYDIVYYWSEKDESMVCEYGKEILGYLQKNYILGYVMKNIDNISPISHENKYKRNYWNYWGKSTVYSDWDFRNFNRNMEDYNLNDFNKFEVVYGDQSLNIYANLEAKYTGSGVEVRNFEIEEMFINEWQYKEVYYKKGTNIIREFIDKDGMLLEDEWYRSFGAYDGYGVYERGYYDEYGHYHYVEYGEDYYDESIEIEVADNEDFIDGNDKTEINENSENTEDEGKIIDQKGEIPDNFYEEEVIEE